MDDKSRKVLPNEEQKNKNKDENVKVETTRRHSIKTNEDGSTSYVSHVIEKKTGAGIIGDPTQIEEYSLGVEMGDTKYVDAIKSKDDLAIMYDEKLITYIKVTSFEKILQLMNENLNTYFDSLAYGIYSTEEIIELRNSIRIEPPKIEKFSKYFEVYLEEDPKLGIFKTLNEDLFDNVQLELDRIKEEEERKRREEEERLRRLKEAEEQKEREREARIKRIKILFEKNMKTYEDEEILKRRFRQFKICIEEAKLLQEKKAQEDQKRILRLKRQKEKEEEERKRKEEEER